LHDELEEVSQKKRSRTGRGMGDEKQKEDEEKKDQKEKDDEHEE